MILNTQAKFVHLVDVRLKFDLRGPYLLIIPVMEQVDKPQITLMIHESVIDTLGIQSFSLVSC